MSSGAYPSLDSVKDAVNESQETENVHITEAEAEEIIPKMDMLKEVMLLENNDIKIDDPSVLNLFGILLPEEKEPIIMYDSSCCGMFLNWMLGIVRFGVFLPAISHLFNSIPVTMKFINCGYDEAALVITSSSLLMPQECQDLNFSAYTTIFNAVRIIIEAAVCLFIIWDCTTSGIALFGFGTFVWRVKIQRIIPHLYLDGFWGVFFARMMV